MPLSLQKAPLLSAASIAFFFLSACGDEQVQCFDNRSCGDGQKCVFPADATVRRGVCAPCDEREIPYDGEDNDCDPLTPDQDLDGDRQNSDQASRNPGQDCDDTDPEIFFGAPERCADGVDNDCDGMTDEAPCDDFGQPEIAFKDLVDQDGVYGSFAITAVATDDVSVKSVDFFINGTLIQTKTEPDVEGGDEYTVTIDSFNDKVDGNDLQDGPLTLKFGRRTA